MMKRQPMKIIKTKVTITVLTEDVPPEFDTLAELEHLMDQGDAIGTYEVDSHEYMHRRKP